MLQRMTVFGTAALQLGATNGTRHVQASYNLPGNHTSYSLRANGVTVLYTAGVPEKIIQD